tara:strand:- start:1638 stop:7859 length:6222 start_codon:yes stop_codon:yes gene_type:complete
MACEYFVGGKYISENEFKALLNEGLLDTLVSNKKIDMKGFKVDATKAISQEPKIVKRLTVPAPKLAKILADEVKSSQGYPANMLSALELNAAGTDFKIPLWASPYADKFESLLASLVTNKVIKQKFPGGSYVLGSEEGFKIKEGDEAAGDLKNSNIIFTSKFIPKDGLQPMRYDKETGKILPAQIMIPFKFRDEQGNILNINEFIIIGEDGRKMLDISKMPEKLLQLFGFRIPSQKRNSMGAVEIVGFLPEAQGDLILAPRDFVKQMGSDFDVDKLYTYMYNHYYLNGKIYTNFKSSAKDIAKLTKIVKDQITELKDNMKISKEERKLIDNYINQVLDATQAGEGINADVTQRANELISKAIAVKAFSEEAKTALNNAITQLSVLNRSYKAARQNKILDLHLEMMTSTNPEIIASIIATDTYGEFEGLAARLADIRREKGLIKAPLTILSDIYQRGKYLNASAGKNALGAFSLDSTFNAITQGKNLAYINLSAEEQDRLFGSPMNPRTPTAEEIMAANDPIAAFGNSISKGDLSNKYTLRSQFVIAKAKAEKRDLTKEEKASLKLKSSIIAALQSTAADNEKGQILDKLNINDDSLQTIKAMTLLGFEENDIAGLITQDIIWEYFETLNKTRSSLTGYQQDAKDKIREALIAKYDPQGKLKGLSPEEYSAMAKMADKSGDELLEMLANSKFNPTVSTSYNLNQLFLLDKFLKLEEVGTSIQQVQSTINTESRGVPKSLLETANKVTQIENLGKSIIFNASELLGTYNADTKVFEPTTISGFAAIYGTEFANTIYRPFFPYQTAGFETLFQEILTHTPSYNKGQSMAKLTEAQKTVFKGVKSFLYSSNNTNLFTGNPDQERNRLFMDVVDGNMSLASILQNLSSQTWFQKNAFLNKLDFNINTNGTPSRIEFEAATAENFDERNIYEGFLSLLDKNFPVGTFNGVEYTSRSLAQELVAAAFLEGGMQGSKQYMKYVPIAYLKTLGFGDYLSNVPFNFVSTFKGTLTEAGAVYSQPSAFTRQYFQNNPELAKSVLTGDLEGKHSKAPAMSFVLSKKAMEANFVDITDPITNEPTKVQTQFLSIKEPKGKIALYEFDAIEKVYRRIPVLKDKFGFVQYNAESSKPIPLEAENAVPINKAVDIPAPNYNIQNIPAETHKEFNIEDVNNTKLPATVATLPISKTLSGTSEALDDLINALVDSGEISTANVFLLNTLQGLVKPDNFKLVYSNDASIKGNYNYETSTVTINPNHKSIKTIDDVATTLAHELVHSATGLTIKQYEAGLTDKLTSEQIKAVENLKSVQNKYIEYLASQGKTAQLAAFTTDYKAWKKGNKSINFTKDQIAEFYGAMKLSEFVTMALTDTAFQERLKNIKDAEDKSLWNQILEAITDLINTLGITIPKGSILAGALKSSMDLINANQEALIEEEDVFFPDVETVTPIKEFEVVGTEILTTEEGALIGEYNTVEEAEKALLELEQREAARKLGEAKTLEDSKFTYEGKTIDTAFNLTVGQDKALKRLVDFAKSKDKFITLQGAAGTGKTAVIGYLQKYFANTSTTFVYMAPTHAATAELAFATVKSGNKQLPMTVQSAVSAQRDRETGELKVGFTKKLTDKLGFSDNIIVLDEVSMLSAKDYNNLKIAIQKHNAKVIFMGDILQIPEVDVANPTQKQVSKAFTDNEQVALTEVKRTESDAILEVLGQLRNDTRPAIPMIPNTEEIKFLKGSEYNQELVDTIKEDPENGVVISYTNNGVSAVNKKIRKLLGREGDLQQGDVIVGYLGYSSKQIENADIANSIRYTVDKVNRIGSKYEMIVKSEKLDSLQKAGVKVSGTASGNYVQLSNTDTFEFEDLTQEDFDTNNQEISSLMQRLVDAKKAALANPRRWVDYYATQGEVARYFSKNILGGDYIYNPATGQMEKFISLQHGQLKKANPELFVEKGIDLGHAITIHKSQGSTIKNVFFDASTLPKGSSSKLFQGQTQIGNEKHSLIYVAMSRASGKLVVNTEMGQNFYSLRGPKLDLSGLQNTEDFMQMPPDADERSGGPSPDDWNAYNAAMSSDDSLFDSPINRELYEKYLLLCGK